MMALQKSLLEQSDIVPVLQGFEIQVDDSGETCGYEPTSCQEHQTLKARLLRRVNNSASILLLYCDACEGEFEIRHGMSETQTECLKCSSWRASYSDSTINTKS
jgi:hypothetical protein